MSVTPDRLAEMAAEARRGRGPEVHLVADLLEQEHRRITKSTPTNEGDTMPKDKIESLLKEAGGPRAALSRVLGGLEGQVSTAEYALQKAVAEKDDFGRMRAKQNLRQARARLTKFKLMAAESIRSRDPAMVTRALRGQGVQMVSNSGALGDDYDLRAI